MKNQVKNIFLELISNREFVKWHMDSSEERSPFWDEWSDHPPQKEKDYFNAKEFLKILRFRADHITGQESENMLSQIPNSTGMIWENIIENRLELSGRHFPEVNRTVTENERGKSKIALPDDSIAHLNYETDLHFPVLKTNSNRPEPLSTGEEIMINRLTRQFQKESV